MNEKNINAVVNAANSILMGSDKGVDENRQAGKKNGFFKEKICKKVDGDEKKAYNRYSVNAARQLRQVYGLCDYVIHVVGTEFDGKSREESNWNYKTCSFSRVQTLESCYYAIVEWKQKASELFALSGIKEIWFYIHKEKGESTESFRIRIVYMQQIIQKYGAKFRQDKKVSFQSSCSLIFR